MGYFKNVIYHFLSAIDGALNFVLALFGKQLPVFSLAESFLMGLEMRRIDRIIKQRMQERAEGAENALEDIKKIAEDGKNIQEREDLYSKEEV